MSDPKPYPFSSHCFVAPGAGGMAGEGYPFHRWWLFNRRWYNRPDVIFQTKGISAYKVQGNMPLEDDGVTPTELFPQCIAASFLRGETINAVGFSNFGIQFYVERGLYDGMDCNWIINFMPLSDRQQTRMREVEHFAAVLKSNWNRFSIKPQICLNRGCPNVDHKAADVAEMRLHHDILLEDLPEEVPIYDNFSVVAPVSLIVDVSEFSDGLFIANTIPHDWTVERGYRWGLGVSDFSPLIGRKVKWPDGEETTITKPGGRSGTRCRPWALKTCAEVRYQNPQIMIIGGNGIQHPDHVNQFCLAGCNGVQVGIAPIVKPWSPWLMHRIICRANSLEWYEPPTE